MPGSLKRLLRIRALREDLSRMQVEAEAARLLEIQAAAAVASREASASREWAFSEILSRELPREPVKGKFSTREQDATAGPAASTGIDDGENGNPADHQIEVGQDEVGQDEVGQDEVGQGEVGQNEAGQDEVGQNGVGQNQGWQNEGWRSAESAWEMAVSRQSGCEQRRPAQQSRVDRARAEFLSDRRDRLQVAALVDEAAARERAEQARRDQRGLDEWFQSWAKRMGNQAGKP